MELKIKLHHKNSYPLGGILIKGSSAEQWIKELQWMRFSLSAVTIYAIPGTQANTLWGCLVLADKEDEKTDTGRNTYCQVLYNILYIPEKSVLYPKLSNAEVDALFKGSKHVLHPEFGLAKLEPVDWAPLIEPPLERIYQVHEPAASVFIPKQIRTFQIKPVAIEKVLDTLEEHFPKQKKFSDKPLNPFEKMKLFLYERLFVSKSGSRPDQRSIEKSFLLSKLESIKRLFSDNATGWADRLQTDYEDLERRNQKHFDRLMDLLKNNPAEALKYAIPLDPDGITRGSGTASFGLQKRWFDFSLFDGALNTGGGLAILPDDAFNKLQMQYSDIARELVKQKDYRKAAFVYMKLLKNYPTAAQTLEEGGLYQEAASVYLKYCGNKLKAAECFEKGNMTMNAIELYMDLSQKEKVGDLYYSIHRKKEAYMHYRNVADGYEQNHQYLKASLLYRNKMDDKEASQELLLKGWRSNKDAFNCLQHYFSNIPNPKQLAVELQAIYSGEVNMINKETFLQVLKHQYKKHHELSASIKDMAYEIIVDHIPYNPEIVHELRAFNKEDKQLIKDTMRFKINRKKR